VELAVQALLCWKVNVPVAFEGLSAEEIEPEHRNNDLWPAEEVRRTERGLKGQIEHEVLSLATLLMADLRTAAQFALVVCGIQKVGYLEHGPVFSTGNQVVDKHVVLSLNLRC